MKDADKLRARFLRDPVPRRLGAIAADLARVASGARREGGADAVAGMLEESQCFIEWTAAESEIAAELVEIQVALAVWRRAWPSAQQNGSTRACLALQAQEWSDRVLARSGLLDEAPADRG